MIIDYFGLYKDARDINKSLSDLNLREHTIFA